MSDDLDPIALQQGQLASRIDHLIGIGQRERAKELALDAIAAQPGSAAGHLNLAVVLIHDHEARPALAAAEQALAIEPDNDVAHRLRAAALLQLGRFAQAEAAVRRAIEIDPHDPTHFRLYAHVLSLCDADIPALHAAEHALELDPDDAGLHQLRARLLLAVHPRHWNLSEDAVRTALRIDPEDADSHAVLGHVLILKGRHDEAERAFRSALGLEPHNPLAIAGLSHLVKGRHWWYRPMLAWSELLSRQGRDGQLAIVFGLWVVYASIAAVLPEEYAHLRPWLTWGYFGLVVYTWFAEPITRALLRRAYPWLE